MVLLEAAGRAVAQLPQEVVVDVTTMTAGALDVGATLGAKTTGVGTTAAGTTGAGDEAGAGTCAARIAAFNRGVISIPTTGWQRLLA